MHAPAGFSESVGECRGRAQSLAVEGQWENVLTECICGLQCSVEVPFLFAHFGFRLAAGKCHDCSQSPAPVRGQGSVAVVRTHRL